MLTKLKIYTYGRKEFEKPILYLKLLSAVLYRVFYNQTEKLAGDVEVTKTTRNQITMHRRKCRSYEL